MTIFGRDPWDQPPRAYAGIGSRETPDRVLRRMTQIGIALARRGWTLRSGAAPGADSAFEGGALHAVGPVGSVGPECIELYLPWARFEGREGAAVRIPAPISAAHSIAALHHPSWDRLAFPVRNLMARNAHQVLGAELDDPVAFVLCWTPDGATDRTTPRTGGTGQAIRIANAHGVPVWNLQRPDHWAVWEKLT